MVELVIMRKIIHIDMDCYFAAVEMRDNPALANIPIAIAGRSARSVVSTCNYLAREYGVRSAMSVTQALKLCPHLELVPGRMSVYKEVSNQIREIFSRYTDLVEPLSLDEAYLDVTDCPLYQGSATLIAEKIRFDIFNELNLTASAGVAPNKFLAKIASDEHKPNGQCVVTPDTVADFVETMPLKKIPGVGPKTLEKLQAQGFFTCADVRASSIEAMANIMGKFGPVIYTRSFGEDTRNVEPSRIRKSLAIETTLSEDINKEQLHGCLDVIENLLPKFYQRLEKISDLDIVRQGIKIKFSDFSQTTVEQKNGCFDVALIKPLLEQALKRGEGKKIRLIGLTLGFEPQKNNDEQINQLSLCL